MLVTLKKLKLGCAFSFSHKDRPCPKYHTGMHIVSRSGLCKCGKRFHVVEVIEEETNADEA
jgi:hypothetical protein